MSFWNLSLQLILDLHNGTDAFGFEGLWWEEFHLDAVCTDSVNITATSHHTSTWCVGFVEVEIYASGNILQGID